MRISGVHPSDLAARPKFVSGRSGGPGCLLIHGLTASPTEVEPIADRLRQINPDITTHAILLNGHGATHEALRRTTWHDWMASVQRGFRELAARCRPVTVVGVSMGALLGLRLAVETCLPTALAMVSPPLRLRSKLAPMARFFKYFKPYIEKDRETYALCREQGLFTYRYRPLESICQLSQLIRSTKPHLSRLRTPLFVAIGKNDPYLSVEAVEQSLPDLDPATRRLRVYARSGHHLPHEDDADEFCDDVAAFLNLHSGSPTGVHLRGS
jgi:carboxylesterase